MNIFVEFTIIFIKINNNIYLSYSTRYGYVELPVKKSLVYPSNNDTLYI
jgi:hypothetical protein